MLGEGVGRLEGRLEGSLLGLGVSVGGGLASIPTPGVGKLVGWPVFITTTLTKACDGFGVVGAGVLGTFVG